MIIGAYCIVHGLELLHADRNFDVLLQSGSCALTATRVFRAFDAARRLLLRKQHCIIPQTAAKER